MKNWIYVVIVLLLGAIAFYFFWQQAQDDKTPKDQAFAIASADDITKIFLADKYNRRVKLTRQDDKTWMVNDKYEVMPVKIDVLLRTMERLRVDMGIPQPRWDNVIKELAVSGIKAEIYKNGEPDPFKTYIMGSTVTNGNGNYALLFENGKPMEKPYIVSLPGLIGDLSVRYILDEKEWRDTKVFRYEIDDISAVKVDYTYSPENSYELVVHSRDSFIVNPLGDAVPITGKSLSVASISKYLSFFESLNAEAFENEFPGKDSVLSTEPLVTITVTDTDGDVEQLVMYRMGISRRSKMQFDPYGNELEYDRDRFYAIFNNGQDFGIVQDFVFGKVLRKRIDFYEKE